MTQEEVINNKKKDKTIDYQEEFQTEEGHAGCRTVADEVA